MLTLKNVSLKIPRGGPLIQCPSLSLRKDQTTVLMGPSGSGKTTLALSLLGLSPKAIEVKGDCLFEGKDMPYKDLNGYRRGFSMVFQDSSQAFNPFFTIGFQLKEVVSRYSAAYPDKMALIVEVLEEMCFSDPQKYLKLYPHQLSGGQRQRFAIAMSLLSEPKILIADEPTASLDLIGKVEVLKLIQKLQLKRRFALLLITHDQLVATKMAHELYHFENNQILKKF